MNFQRVSALAKKDLKKTLRDPAALFMVFLFPVVFVLAFGASFGGIGGGQPVTYQIGVVNMDQTGSSQQWSQVFIDALSNATILNVQVYTNNQTAQDDARASHGLFAFGHMVFSVTDTNFVRDKEIVLRDIEGG